MKTNHAEVALRIRQAIEACGYDGVMDQVRNHLHQALSKVQTVASKRGKLLATQEANRIAREKAVEAQKKWWQTIIEGMENKEDITEE